MVWRVRRAGILNDREAAMTLGRFRARSIAVMMGGDEHEQR
jgi:hypothetical protein